MTPDFEEEKKLWRRGYPLVIGVDEVGRGAFVGPVVAGAVVFMPFFRKYWPKTNGPNISHHQPQGRKYCLNDQHVLVKYTNSKISQKVGNYNDNDIKDNDIKNDIKTVKAQNDKLAICGNGNNAEYISFDKLINLGIRDSKQLTAKKREELEIIIKKNCFVWTTAEVGVSVINRIGIGKATEKAMRRAILRIMNYELRIKNRDRKKRQAFVLADAFHIKYLVGIGLKNQKAIVRGDQKCISIAAASILAKVHRDRIMRQLSQRYPKYGWGRNKGYGTLEHRQVIEQVGITKWHRQAFVKTWQNKRMTKNSPS